MKTKQNEKTIQSESPVPSVNWLTSEEALIRLLLDSSRRLEQQPMPVR